MNKNTLTAFLYSNKNLEIATNLKNFCSSYDMGLFYITDLKEYFIKESNFEHSVLFIDNFTTTVSKDLIDFLTVKTQTRLAAVIYLCDGELKDETIIDNDKVFKINVKDAFYSKLLEVVAKLKERCVDRKVKDYNKEWASIVYDYLLNSNLSPKHAGFSYLKDAIIFCLAENGRVGNLNKGAYTYLSEKYDTTIFNIERNIRLAIDSAWKGQTSKTREFVKKPSNKEFIAVGVNVIYNEID